MKTESRDTQIARATCDLPFSVEPRWSRKWTIIYHRCSSKETRANASRVDNVKNEPRLEKFDALQVRAFVGLLPRTRETQSSSIAAFCMPATRGRPPGRYVAPLGKQLSKLLSENPRPRHDRNRINIISSALCGRTLERVSRIVNN